MSRLATLVLCFFVAGVHSLTLDQINVEEIKAGRDKVPAEEILALVRSLTDTHLQGTELTASKKGISSLIGQLEFDPSTIGKTYIFYQTDVPWFTALSYCARAGYELATITSAAEQLAVIQWLFANDQSNEYWIAATNALSSYSNYTWLSGTCTNYTEMNFNYWYSEPTGYSSAFECAAVEGEYWGYWFEYECSYDNYYICQKYY